MANLTLSGMGSTFGEGTTVAVYPAAARSASGGAPSGAEVTHADVTADVLAFTGLTAGVAYVAHAVVGGVSRYVGCRIASFVAGAKWQQVVADRRTAIGTS